MAEAQSTILIVDDDAEDLAAVAQALGSLGAELVTLRDPHEVLPTVRGLAPDVVVLDALLPGLSGFDLCKEIKTDAELRTTQVLIVTAVYLRQQYRHEALQQFKADAFLTKPFRPPELQRLVANLLSRKSRKPQGRFLRRLGVSGRPAKGSILGRLFGRGGEKAETDTRLTPPRPARRPPDAVPAEDSGVAFQEIAAEASSPPSTERAQDEAATSSGAIALPATLPESPEVAPEVAAAEDVTAEDTSDAKAEDREMASEPLNSALPASSSPESSECVDEPTEPASQTESAPEDIVPAESSADVEVSAMGAEPEPAPLPSTGGDSTPSPESSVADAEKAETAEAGRIQEVRDAVDAELGADATPSSQEELPFIEDAVEDAVTSVEHATSENEHVAAENEPTAAEALEATPSDAGSDVAWEPAEVAPARATAPKTVRFEPSKTLPEVELPRSLEGGAARDPAEVEPSAHLVSATELDGAPENAPSPESAELDPPEEIVPEPRTASPAMAPSTEPSPNESSEPTLAKKRRTPRRRVGEAPLFDEGEFDAELRRELSKCRRVDRPLTLILIQVDDIRQIVELFGKEFREDVLWHVADQAMASLREVDIVGMISSKDRVAMTAFASDRYGGSRIVTRMRRTVGKHPIRVGEELPPIIPELSFGMASYPEDADDAEVLMSRAEEDLRSAKAHRED